MRNLESLFEKTEGSIIKILFPPIGHEASNTREIPKERVTLSQIHQGLLF